jgi:hypothetical protein
MLVFNTNADIGAGIYVWSGTKWTRVDNEHGAYGPNLVVGSNTYRTYIYPGNIGTWMLDPSKEGTPDCKQYQGKTEGERGYYYKKANYASACLDGWHVPSRGELEKLMNYLMVQATSIELADRTKSEVLAGGADGEGRGWGERGLYASNEFPHFLDVHELTVNSGSLNADYCISVFCIKNQ